MSRKIEVCCTSVADVVAARDGGAVRVELCSAISAGGVTPSAALVATAVRERGEMAVNVLIRPREGGFVYSDEEVSVMAEDIAAVRMAGADGVVIGVLTPEGEIDIPAMRRMLGQAEGLSVTFHRAFDDCRDPFAALDILVELGIDRVLTSGQSATAVEGAQLLARLVEYAAGRIIIMPGAGVSPANIDMVHMQTGASEFHSTAADKTAARPSSPLFGMDPPRTSKDIVAALVGC